MRTPAILLSTLLLLVAVAAGCGGGDEPEQAADHGTTSASMEMTMMPGLMVSTEVRNECPRNELPLVTEETVTVAVDDGDTESFQKTLALEAARQLNFLPSEVEWVTVAAGEALEPGSTDFDFALVQPAGQDGLTQSSTGVDLVLVAPSSSPIANATSIAELREATLGALAGMKGEWALANVVEPTAPAWTFDSLEEATSMLLSGEAEGLVVDLATARQLLDEVEGARVVGQLPPTGAPDEFAFLVGNDELRDCLDLVLHHFSTASDWVESEEDRQLAQQELPALD